MNLDIYPTLVQRDPKWYQTSKRLHEYLNRDFRSIRDEVMPKLFPRSHGSRLPRDVPLVWSLARELTPHYRRGVDRRFIDGDASTSVIARVLDGLRINTVMKRLSELLITQGTVVGLFRPISGHRWKIDLFPPYMVEWDADPADSANIQAAREVRLKVALESSHRQVRYGIMKITQDSAEYVGSKTTGVYSEDGRLPFDRLPLFVARLGEPETPGSGWSPLPVDLHDAQISVSTSLADWEFTARATSHGQRVITGNITQSRAEALQFGPDTVIGLDPDSSFNVVTPTTNLSDYIASTSKFWDMLRVTYGLRPQDYTRAVTAVAKRIEMIDRDAHQDELNSALVDCENDLAATAAAVLSWNFGAGTGSIRAPKVQMSYARQEMPADVLHQAQSDQLSASMGITSPSRIVAARMGVSLDEARAIVRENLEEYAATQRAAAGGSDGV